jgi:membrane protein DedA with SNARE-associated domain
MMSWSAGRSAIVPAPEVALRRRVPDALTDLLARYGSFLVALVFLLEGCGIPVPSATTLVTAAALAARGALSIWAVAIGAAIGGTAGGLAGYGIGIKGGMRLVRRYGARVGIDDEKLVRARKFFSQRGAWAVFLSRFVGVVRIVVPMIAGVAHMRFAPFFVANAAGSIGTAAGYAALGWFFGRDLPKLRHHLTEATLVVLALLGGWGVLRHVRERRRASA